jgi:hypothetical protein
MLKVQIFLILSVTFGSEAQTLIPNSVGRIIKDVGSSINPFNLNQHKQTNVYAQACQGIYLLQQDYFGYFGVITIANPDYSRNVLKMDMSLAARLSNVSRRATNRKPSAHNVSSQFKLKF